MLSFAKSSCIVHKSLSQFGTWDVGQLIDGFLKCAKPWDRFSESYKPSIVPHAYSLRPYNEEVGKSEAQGHSWLHSKLKFEVSLVYVRLCQWQTVKR